MTTRQPNAGLERLYRESGWTLRQFAQEVNRIGTERGTPLKYQQPSVHQWLSGHLPKETVRPLILEALARRLLRPITHADAGFPAPSEESNSHPTTVEGLVDLGRQDMDPSRRSVLSAGLFSVALTVPGWPDVVGRMEAVQSGKTQRIGMADVNMVIAMTERVSDLDDQFGGRHARPMAAAFLVNTVSPYLRADATEEVRKAMMSAASDLCYLTGYMAVDEGVHGLAQQYYLKALELAGASEDHLTYCTTLRGMSVQAVDLRHGKTAMRLADAAASASPQAGPRMRAFLAGQQAHASAQLGEPTKALMYLREAEVAMEKAESQTKTFGSYNSSSLTYHAGQVRYELGDIRGSVKDLEESDKLRHSSFKRNRIRYLSMLAERQLEIGHLESACATWVKVVEIYPDVQSGQCDKAMSTMQDRLRPYLKNQTVRSLYERARLVTPPSVAV
ncbi:tetratricopeptide repeat protein [Streptomyces sp. NBC_00053]|uniref:tetratricopeptide repeat protein n=1 Tax=unclassified Streptomyces TaxID=2593676 RepID=UPI000F5B9960|nr:MULTISPECIES: tetratricopeptide repeat protein [unclassified Streptomyces]MCX5500219.1 tetratricopeptide repeat protein [Streptomyces sp. NBC_00052]MCX5551246.1 tetratricopeptide repeat protein [Streptomyces sp. NBC_00051]WSG50554.1 tetratricopeptide repeat protein [Streptomyces sp. NBC_01732]WSX01210.1 tetratricopeptide repeat protein [Streptomyces sp. NBC_00987]